MNAMADAPVELGPFRGAPQTVALVKRYAVESQRHPDVRLLAEDVLPKVKSKDYLSEILAIYNYVLANTRYTNDPRNVELVKKPWRVVRQMRAGQVPGLDCDDLVCLIAALLLAVGREVQIVTVGFRRQHFRGQIQYSHVFLRVREPRTGRWVVLDPVAAEDTRSMIRRVQVVKIWPVA